MQNHCVGEKLEPKKSLSIETVAGGVGERSLSSIPLRAISHKYQGQPNPVVGAM